MRSGRFGRSSCIPAVALAAGVACTGFGISPEQRAAIAAYEAAYSVRVERVPTPPTAGTTFGTVEASPAPPADLAAYLPILEAESAKSGPRMFRCADVRRVALVSRLAVAGKSRAAVPDWGDRTLFLDVGYAAHEPEYSRWVFHHELFHLVDYADDELIRHDPEWTALNPPGFAYGAGGDRAYHDEATAYAWDVPPPGFVSLYATLGAEEDKAETYAALMTGAPIAMDDPALVAKVALLRHRLATQCGVRR
jgi:hypothetical protein